MLSHTLRTTTEPFVISRSWPSAILGAGYLSAHLSFAFKSATFRRLSGSLVMLYGVWTVAPLVWMI